MKSLQNKQRGATLIMVLITVALLAILAVYGVGMGVLDQRSSANSVRAREALSAAESGIEQAFSYVQANRSAITGWTWTNCTATATTLPCSQISSTDRANWKHRTVPAAQVVQPSGSSFTAYLLTPIAGLNKHLMYNLVAEGKSGDESATRVARQGAFLVPLIAKQPDSPLLAGNASFSGNYSLVAAPAKAGPISIWSNTDVSMGGSAASCHVNEFLKSDSTYVYQTDGDGNTLEMCASCVCQSSTTTLSKNGVEAEDILDIEPGGPGNGYPGDMFQYMFGVPASEHQTIKSQATLLADCSSLDTSSAGIYWVTGNCQPSNNVGSFAHPVMVVVEGSSRVNSGNYFFGVLFAFSPSGLGAMTVDLNGTPTVYGAIMSNVTLNNINGNFKMRFDSQVLKNLVTDPAGRSLVKIPGSWADY